MINETQYLLSTLDVLYIILQGLKYMLHCIFNCNTGFIFILFQIGLCERVFIFLTFHIYDSKEYNLIWWFVWKEA